MANPDPLLCPDCGQDRIDSLVGASGNLLVIYECQVCGHRWSVERVRPWSEVREEWREKYGEEP